MIEPLRRARPRRCKLRRRPQLWPEGCSPPTQLGCASRPKGHRSRASCRYSTSGRARRPSASPLPHDDSPAVTSGPSQVAGADRRSARPPPGYANQLVGSPRTRNGLPRILARDTDSAPCRAGAASARVPWSWYLRVPSDRSTVNEPAAPSGRCPDSEEWDRARTFHHDPWAPGNRRRRYRVLPR